MFYRLGLFLLCIGALNAHEIRIEGIISCPASQEFEAFSQSIESNSSSSSSYEEWKQEFQNNTAALMELVESENIEYTSWMVTIDEDLPGKLVLEKMLTAIAEKDHPAFIEPGSDAFQEQLSTKHFEHIATQDLGLSNYSLSYLGTLSRGEYREILWKLIPEENVELLIHLILNEDDKVDGIWIQ